VRDSLNIAIAGSTGYIGLELIKILSRHPYVKILYLCATKSIGKTIYSFDKKISKKKLPKISKLEKINWNKVNVLFTALPNGQAHKIIKFLPKHVKLIDLSADFRLKNYKTYEHWYKIKHKSINYIKDSVYALTEFSRKELINKRIISCPGCYPTSIQLPLIPLIQKNAINLNNIVVDSKSGFSGAGKNLKKKFKNKNLFSSISVYGAGAHRHMPEIDQEFTKNCKKKINVFFTPHLIPTFRGILSTIYIDAKGKWNAKRIFKFLKSYHKKNYFVKIVKFNSNIGTGDVINSNFCHISVCENRIDKKVIIVSAIDNLVKGGSGQAVQNMNVAFNFKENLGLL